MDDRLPMPVCSLSPDAWPADERVRAEALEQIFRPPGNKSVQSRFGIITTTTSPIALLAGLQALRSGGTAADAALTTALTQVVTSFGSYVSYAGIMQALYYTVEPARTYSLNAGWNSCALERDPASIPRSNLSGTEVTSASADQAHGRKTLVPGFMAGVQAMHDRFGRLPFAEICKPAIWYAEHGVIISERFELFFKQYETHLSRTAEGRAFLRQAGGTVPRKGCSFVQAELAETLRSVAREGAMHMYRGNWAHDFVDIVRREEGAVTREDLGRYEVLWEDPLATNFLGQEVLVPGEYAEAGRQVLQALNLIEELQLHTSSPYWQDEQVFDHLSRILAFVSTHQHRPEVAQLLIDQGIDFSAEATIKKDYAKLVAPLLTRLCGTGSTAQASNHSDAVVAIDPSGNIAALVHTSNTLLWGDSGIVVGGIPVPDPAGLQQGLLTCVEPGTRVPDTMATTMVLRNTRPVLATAAVGSFSVLETVRMLLGILGNRLPPEIVRSAPPLLLNFQTGSDALVPDGRYDPQFLQRFEALGRSVSQLASDQVRNVRGTAVLCATDPDTDMRHSMETEGTLGMAVEAS